MFDITAGVQLGQKFGEETMHLSPPLESVPWLVVNDKPIGKVGALSLSLSHIT